MAYYPKSQIKTNLYTNGGEYTTSSNPNSLTVTEYKGYYYKTSTGQLYTGKSPSDKPNQILYPLSPNSITFESGISTPPPPNNTITINNSDPNTQYSISNNPKTRIIPQFSLSQPTPEDKKRGFFIRYFCKKNNELIYFETSQADHDRIKSQDPTTAYDLYSAASLKWYITGDPAQVTSQNVTQVNQVSSTNGWLGFIQYFKGDFNRYLGS
jgi:hypothetical protein